MDERWRDREREGEINKMTSSRQPEANTTTTTTTKNMDATTDATDTSSSYPQLRVFKCHTVAHGAIKPGSNSGFDHSRWRKVLREDELCPDCEKRQERQLIRSKSWLVPRSQRSQ